MKSNNKIALVTGASKGIGKGVALAFAKAGYNVVVSDIDEQALKEVAKEVEDLGVKALSVVCDVSKRDQVDAMISKTLKTFGVLHVIVNNAGIYPFVEFMKMTEADWDKVMDVNLKGVFFCSQAAAKVMPEGGRIIQISSIAASVGFPGLVHYCATKGGVSSMIRPLAIELANKKITVNAVAPGAIETPGASGAMTEDFKKQTISAIPLSRMGQPDDIAQAVVFLASEGASYITGQTIIVDGGWTLH